MLSKQSSSRSSFRSTDTWICYIGWRGSARFERDRIGYQHGWRCLVFVCQVSAEEEQATEVDIDVETHHRK